MMQRIYSPLFLLALLLLLLNDHWLKMQYPGWVSGKLSDFAGLFVFAYFWACVFPKWARWIHILSALLFIWWKSAFSQPFIAWWSEHCFVIVRVVDYSDLIALLMLPLAYRIWRRPVPDQHFVWSHTLQHTWRGVLVMLTLFAFVATSLPPRYTLPVVTDEKTYYFPYSKEELQERILDRYTYDKSLFVRLFGPTMVQNVRIDSLLLQERGIWLNRTMWDKYADEVLFHTQDTIDLALWRPYSGRHMEVQMVIGGDSVRSHLRVQKLRGIRRKPYDRKREKKARQLLRRFERKFIRHLQ